MIEPEIEFYMAPQTRAVTVHWMLEEVGAPYRMRVLDLEAGEHKRPAFLAINPMGKVPAIVHQGTVITEVAAICLYLADAFVEAAGRRRSAIRGAARTCDG
jgi:glutathione S-transferase